MNSTLICTVHRQDENKIPRKLQFPSNQFPSEIHSNKLLLQLYRDLLSFSTDLNCHIFESIFNRLAVQRYIPIRCKNIFLLGMGILSKSNIR